MTGTGVFIWFLLALTGGIIGAVMVVGTVLLAWKIPPSRESWEDS